MSTANPTLNLNATENDTDDQFREPTEPPQDPLKPTGKTIGKRMQRATVGETLSAPLVPPPLNRYQVQVVVQQGERIVEPMECEALDESEAYGKFVAARGIRDPGKYSFRAVLLKAAS